MSLTKPHLLSVKSLKGGMACIEGKGGFSNEQCLGLESCSLRSNSFSDKEDISVLAVFCV